MGMDFYSGHMIEKSPSMDIVFVIALIFGFLAIPRQHQHRVLFWAILALALALALVFTSASIFLIGIIGKIAPATSLSVTLGLVAGGLLVSLWNTRGQTAAAAA